MEKKVCKLYWESLYDILGYAKYGLKELRFRSELHADSYADRLLQDIEHMKEVCLSEGSYVVVSMSDEISD